MCEKSIIFLIWRDRPGGIEVLLPGIKNELRQFSFSACILRTRNKNDRSVFDNSNTELYFVAKSNLALYPKLYLYLKKNKKAVMHGFNLGPFVLLVLRLAGIKRIIYSIHGTVYWKTNFQRAIRKFFWNLALNDKVVFTANSGYSRKIFTYKVSNKPRIKVIYNPFDTKRFFIRNVNSYDINKLKIFYCGRLANGKNLYQWIDMAAEILKTNPLFQFNIYGMGPLHNALGNQIKLKNLKNRIFLTGFRNDIENVYHENDLLVFLSEYESFGNVVVESILCGTPVIAAKIPAMEEIFENYPEFLVDLDENLFVNILEKIKYYEKLRALAFKAAIEFKERFSLEKHIKELENIYKSFE